MMLFAAFAFKGRIDRPDFWRGLLATYLIQGGGLAAGVVLLAPASRLLDFEFLSAMSVVGLLAAVWALYRLASLGARRFHDIGWPGQLATLAVAGMLALNMDALRGLPGYFDVVLYLGLVLTAGLLPGQQKTNRYGERPRQVPDFPLPSPAAFAEARSLQAAPAPSA